MAKKKAEEKVEEEKTGKVYISCNEGLEVVIPGIPGIIVLRPGENEIKDRGEFKALDLANAIVKDHSGDKPNLSLQVIEK